MDLVFILDSSTSVSEANLEKIKNFVIDLLEDANIDNGHVRVGVLLYSTRVATQFYLRDYRTKSEVIRAIKGIQYIRGRRNTADAIRKAWSVMFTPYYGDRPEAKNIAILITNGVSDMNSYRTVIEANTAKDRGIHIYSIGVGLRDTRELHGIASVPSSRNVVTVRGVWQLKDAVNTVTKSLCLGISRTLSSR